MKLCSKLIFVFTLMTVGISPAQAQMSFPVTPMLNNRLMMQSVNTQGTRSAWADNDENSNYNNDSERTANFTFQTNPRRTRLNLSKMVEQVRTVDPISASNMEKIFSSVDVIAEFGKQMRSMELNPNNIADVYAVWWISAWKATRGDHNMAPIATYKAVSTQAASGFASVTDFESMDDAQKQEMAEFLMVHTLIIESGMEEAAANPTQMRALSKLVNDSANASGMNLQSINLTENGFVVLPKH